VITSGLSRRWIFLVNVPVGIATIAVTLARVAESRDPDATRPDWLGFASFSVALAALVCRLIPSRLRLEIGQGHRQPERRRARHDMTPAQQITRSPDDHR
jgi:hypothetical protein